MDKQTITHRPENKTITDLINLYVEGGLGQVLTLEFHDHARWGKVRATATWRPGELPGVTGPTVEAWGVTGTGIRGSARS
jgi:hypothetical protein